MKKKFPYKISAVTICESHMYFGPFDRSRVWYIENSKIVASLGNGIKIAEFIHIQPQNKSRVLIVEAKSSSPKKENINKLQEYISDISEKLSNSFNIYLATIQNRHSVTKERIPAKLKCFNVGKADIKLVLVINDHKESWLADIQDALRNSLRTLVKTWALGATSVKVVNQDGARLLNLVK